MAPSAAVGLSRALTPCRAICHAAIAATASAATSNVVKTFPAMLQPRAAIARTLHHDAVMRNPATLLLVFSLLACGRGDAQVPAVNAPHDPLLQHHEIRADRLPAPYATQSAGNPPIVVAPPADARFHVPPGFRINLYASGFDDPRTMLLAPNDDVIVAEPGGGKITILRDANHDGIAERRSTFASGLDEPFGLALHGGFLYVGNNDAMVRYAYRPGQLVASGPL